MLAFLAGLSFIKFVPYNLYLTGDIFRSKWAPLGLFLFIFYTLFLSVSWVTDDLLDALEEKEATPKILTKIPWFKPEGTPFEDFTYRIWHVCIIAALLSFFIIGPYFQVSLREGVTVYYIMAWQCFGFFFGQGCLRLIVVIITDTLAGRRWPMYKRSIRKFMGFIDT
jgi:hypothetical protein